MLFLQQYNITPVPHLVTYLSKSSLAFSFLLLCIHAAPMSCGLQARRLEFRGGEALLQVLDQELSQLERYSHMAFTSRNGIAAVLERLATMHGSLRAAAVHLNALPLRCCALGADAEMLADAGVDDVLTPQEVCVSLPAPNR